MILLVGVLASAQSPPNGKLAVVCEAIRNAKGVVGLLVFDSAKGWPEDVKSAIRSKDVEAHPGSSTIVIENLKPGVYAVVVLHDENGNMKLDRNWLGKPKEGWGMSNNPKPFLSAPSFDRAKFTFAGTAELRIRLRYR